MTQTKLFIPDMKRWRVPELEEKEVLIIEDSPAVGILLKEFLTKLGFKKIHSCQNGKTGIETFKEIIESGTVPLVFLDYNLPDMNAFSIMSQLLNIRPDIKVIIETARDKTEESIKDVIAQGAYQYLAKPIRLDKIKEIVETLKNEEAAILNEEVSAKIANLMSNTTQISILRLSQYLGKTEEEILSSIKQLISDKKVIQINTIKEIACPRCNHVRVAQMFHCPKCNGVDFKQERIIEHYKCGNVSTEASYVDDKCPKCHQVIKVFGVDYRKQDNFYACNECKEIFSIIFTEYMCLKCSERFTLEHAKLLTSQGYSWLK
ncbi:response regulator [Candidatus Nitrosotenuis sp. DW1]|nr:response regulator [Candidatus Nitrosotenuis sp. DW1]